MKNAVEIKKLKKQYEGGFCLGEIDLDIPKGCIVGLIGENGAGKTTFIKAVLGIVKTDCGDVSILGQNGLAPNESFKEDIGVVLDDMFFPEILTPTQIQAVMKETFHNWDAAVFDSYMKMFGLPAGKKIKEMSKGMRKKLEIATALAHHPRLLILDEPTSNLDPVVRNEILDIFLQFIQDEENTVLLSTHITSDLEYVADRIVFMDDGKVLMNESRDDILDTYGILKTDLDSFGQIDASDILTYRKNRYGYEILVKNRAEAIRKYARFVVDKITLDALMVFMIKGVKVC